MFVPVVAYDPDYFADGVAVFSMAEVFQSNPYVRPTIQTGAFKRQTVSASDSVALWATTASLFYRQTVSGADTLQQKTPFGNQVQSKFTTRTFTSSLPQAVQFNKLVTGEFATSVAVDALMDNILFRVNVTQISLADTGASNKPVAPAVGG